MNLKTIALKHKIKKNVLKDYMGLHVRTLIPKGIEDLKTIQNIIRTTDTSRTLSELLGKLSRADNIAVTGWTLSIDCIQTKEGHTLTTLDQIKKNLANQEKQILALLAHCGYSDNNITVEEFLGTATPPSNLSTQDQRELLLAFKSRIKLDAHILDTDEKRENAQTELNKMFSNQEDTGLTSYELDLIQYLASAKGKGIAITFRGEDSSQNQGGGDVTFGKDTHTRTRWQLLMHELSHCINSQKSKTTHRSGYLPGMIFGTPHVTLYSEFDANVYATNGNYKEALAMTKETYTSTWKAILGGEVNAKDFSGIRGLDKKTNEEKKQILDRITNLLINKKFINDKNMVNKHILSLTPEEEHNLYWDLQDNIPSLSENGTRDVISLLKKTAGAKFTRMERALSAEQLYRFIKKLSDSSANPNSVFYKLPYDEIDLNNNAHREELDRCLQ